MKIVSPYSYRTPFVSSLDCCWREDDGLKMMRVLLAELLLVVIFLLPADELSCVLLFTPLCVLLFTPLLLQGLSLLLEAMLEAVLFTVVDGVEGLFTVVDGVVDKVEEGVGEAGSKCFQEGNLTSWFLSSHSSNAFCNDPHILFCNKIRCMGSTSESIEAFFFDAITTNSPKVFLLALLLCRGIDPLLPSESFWFHGSNIMTTATRRCV